MKYISWAKPKLELLDKKNLNNAFNSNWISDGYYIKVLEKKFNKFLINKNTLLVNNGTSAIQLAYLALELKKNDEIIIPGYGYMAAANLALQMGFKPVFADVDLDTFCIDVNDIKNKISKKTKLIVAINTYGNVCEFDEINFFAKKKGIMVLEDAAESLGSTYNNKQSGFFGDISTFSFQATKAITCGEGGLVTINKKEKKIFNYLKLYKSHGVEKKKYFHIVPGNNFRLTNLQASMLYSQLRRLTLIKKERKKIFNLYTDLLKKKKEIKIQKFNDNVDPMFWTLALTLNVKKKIKRDKLMTLLMKKNIETRNGFYSPNKLKIYKKFKMIKFNNSDYLADNIICFPLYPGLSEKQIQYITKSFLELLN